MIPLHDVIPPRRRPLVTLLLIGLIAVLSAWQLPAPAPATTWPWLSVAWTHTGWVQLVANLGLLWLFGENVEDRMGRVRFLMLFLISGAFGLAGESWMTGHPPAGPGVTGAVAGVGAAYLLRFPRSRVHVLLVLPFYVELIEVIAVAFLAVWFLLQIALGADAIVWTIAAGFAAGGLLHRLGPNARDYWIRTSPPAAARRATPAPDR